MITLRILFFSSLRAIAGEEIERSYNRETLTVGGCLDLLTAEFPGLEAWRDRVLVAVNLDYADADAEIPDGAEVAIMPPVQGG